MAELPSGTVTFLFTDLESSTQMWEAHPDAMPAALARHFEILRGAIEMNGGHVVKTMGDGFFAVFGTAQRACVAAIEAQEQHFEEPWGTTAPLKVRMALHTCVVEPRDGDYFGGGVNRAARLMAAGHGGQVLCSASTTELLNDADYELLDLGEHRLRDLSRPEHIFQLCIGDLPRDFPPLRSLDSYRGNLPARLTSFVGRDEDVKGVVDALRHSRLVTLTGTGGAGKTRLALEVAAEMLPEFPDGAWFCELAPATDEDSLLQVVATTIGTMPRPGNTLEDAIVECFRSKRALLLLDNCEHLLDAAARLAEHVLQAGLGPRVLATSREALLIAGEQVQSVSSLPMDDSVQLFAERARAVVPNFTVDRGNDAVEEICRRLDGIPLAIELAAARTEAMSPTEIAVLLDERFRLLTGGRRTADERHHTLRATVAWSYSLLDQREKVMFERLAVFVGSFDETAAAAVVTGDDVEAWDVRDALLRLVRTSMLSAEPDEDGITRYSMLETLRQYGREQLGGAGTTDARSRRHAHYYAALAQTLGPQLQGADELAVRRRVRTELDNLRAAFVWALDRDDIDDSELAIVIVASLATEAVYHVASGVGRWATTAAERAERSSPGRRHAVLGAAANGVIRAEGDLEAAAALARRALHDGTPADSPALSMAHTALAIVQATVGEYDAALETIADLQRVAESGDAAFHRAAAHATRAMVLASIGRDDHGVYDSERALELARSIPNPSLIATALFAVGWVAYERDPLAALTAFDECLALIRAGADDGTKGTCLTFSARISTDLGDASKACAILREAIVFSFDVGDQPNAAWALWETLDLCIRLDVYEPAAILCGAFESGALQQFRYPDPMHTAVLERAVAATDSSAWRGARTAGASLTYPELVERVLASLDTLAEAATTS